MPEWTIVTVITVLMGLVASIIAPIIKLTVTITKLDQSVVTLNGKLVETNERNTKAHDVLFTEQRVHADKISGHAVQIADHEKRITRLEPK